MSIEAIIGKLEHCKGAGQGAWLARCPAHDDGRASLSIKIGDNRGVLLFCHAGCSIESIVAAIGMTVADIMPPKDNFNAKPEIHNTYDYRDEAGNLLYQAVRMIPKDFRQRKPAPGGGWEWKLGDTRRVPFRLPELIAADPLDTVFVVEGEKDVNNLVKLGFVATCNVGGAGKWKDEYSEFLRDRTVVILPDNDKPGMEHAGQVERSLKGIARKVTTLTLPGLKEKGDVSDWIEAGGTKAKLMELLARPEPGAIRTTTIGEAAAAYLERLAKGGPTLIPLGLGEVDYAIGGGVELGEMVVLAARPSHGKSMVALQCIHNWTAANRPCAFVSEEMSTLAIGKRALQFMSEMPERDWEYKTGELRSELNYYREQHQDCIIIEACGSVEKAAEQIEKAKREFNIQCAVVDYAQLLTGKGQNRYQQVTHTSIVLRQLASSQKIVLMVLAQLSRGVEQRDEFKPVNADLKDSGQIEQDADVILHMCWPHRIDSAQDPEDFLFFVGKNRNRAINKGIVNARFLAARQMVVGQETKPVPNETFDAYNRSEEYWQ